MLKTDAWCYLNLENPMCAWAAYRGSLVQPPHQSGFISVWVASMLKSNDPERLTREFDLEKVRSTQYPSLVSRLRGMYIFKNKNCAELATSWNGPFKSENLCELSLIDAKITGIEHDANWITHPDTLDWMDQYWSGVAHPKYEPIWETLVEGRLLLLGTELREKAFSISQKAFPDSMDLLEVGRLAALAGSDLGNITPFLKVDSSSISLQYLLDMRDAKNKNFLSDLKMPRKSGHLINYPAIAHLLSQDTITPPDFTPFGFTRPLSEMPYIKISW
jgi:hypothetical protein